MTLDGELITIDERPALRFERRYPHPVERVWRAVTEPDELAAWFPSAVVGERAVGAELVFDDDAQRAEAHEKGEPTRADGPAFTGRVIAYDPPTVFSFSWGGEVLRFELHPDGDGTRLLFTQVLSHRSAAARNGAGWHGCLAGLDALLGAPAADPDDGFAAYQDFVDEMGPERGAPDPGRPGALTWELGHHVGPERVRDAVSEPDQVEQWGGAARADDHVHWDIRSAATGSTVRITVDGAADDPKLAAAWHALVVQLDMYLAADTIVPVDAERFVRLYR